MRRQPRRRPRIEALEARQLLTVEAELLVGWRPGLSRAAERRLLARVGAEPVESWPGGPTRAALKPGTDVAAAMRQLARLPGVRYVDQNGILRVDAVSVNDPEFGLQWGLNQANDVDINAPEAWALTGGGVPTIVAVIDSGITVEHPELAGRLWVNPGEIPGNGLDDDGNGYADDVHGWNFASNTADLTDEVQHGTHVAGIIAAQAGDGRGVVGVNPGAVLMPLKFIDASGTGRTADAVRAIYYAVNEGARVINASWGGGSNSRALADAIRYAGSRGVVFVAAAGNEGLNLDVYRSYPASYGLATMVTVAAVDAAGRLASFSNRGGSTVSIAAPGVGILSTWGTGGTALMSGTSMAAPFVSGVASLVIGANPTLTASQVVQRLIATAKPLGSLEGRVVAGGMVDAARALVPPAVTTPVVRRPRARRPMPPARSVGLGPSDRVRAELLGSNEYYQAHGGSAIGFVTAIYQDLMGRGPTNPERRNGLTQLRQGTSRAGLARQLLGREEAARTKVALWYLNDLAVPASLDQLKQNGLVTALARRLRAGAAESQIRAELLASGELERAAGGDSGRLADLLYQAALARPATADEAADLTARLAAGTSLREVALALLVSDEGRRTRAARWLQSDLLRPGSLEWLKSDPLAAQLAMRLTD
ncbi:MAG: hypothetical protein KatS3mg108_3852 [Isosphaeraceae bacterium]|nr:MAG: hypothetical protein KatS3mg108_3852 [Isosphaeraceae bacterium]